MKGAIASVEIFAFENGAVPQRLSLTIAGPHRCADGEGWECRVALANLHRPETVTGSNSFEALAKAIDRARGWVADLRAQGLVLTRDRAGESAFEFV